MKAQLTALWLWLWGLFDIVVERDHDFLALTLTSYRTAAPFALNSLNPQGLNVIASSVHFPQLL
jgi:hypothetical protein